MNQTVDFFSVSLGFLEDFLLEDEYYNDLDANFTAIQDEVEDFQFSLLVGQGSPKDRRKRQAGFPGREGTVDDNGR